MDHTKKRCVVLGTGPRGSVLARALHDHPDALLVGVCEPDPGAAARFADRFHGVGMYADLTDLLRQCHPDLAIVATPPRRHGRDGRDVLEAGLPALVECPMVETADEAEELAVVARRKGLPVAMAESFCYLPAIQVMRQVVADRYAAGPNETLLGGDGCYLEMDLGIPANGWRDDYEMARYLTHSLGPLLYVTGHRARQVTGFEPLGRRSRGQGAVLPLALVETHGGAVFCVANSGLAPRPLTRWGVVGESWSTESDPFGAIFDGALRLFAPADADPASGRWTTVPVSPAEVYQDLWGTGWEPERLMIRRFVAVLDGAAPDLDLDLSLNISLAGAAAAESGRTPGTVVQVPRIVDAEAFQ